MLKMGVNLIRSWLLAAKIEKQSTKCQTCHQEFLSPTHVINIDAADPFRAIKKSFEIGFGSQVFETLFDLH